MVTIVFQHFLCIFLISLAFALTSDARPSKSKAENPTSLDFIKNLEGSQKGQTVKGLQQARKYLEAFGYLKNSPNQTHPANADNFDDALEVATKTYQLNYHLKITGTLDTQTVSQMMAPRCGVPDIINGTNWMQVGKRTANHTNTTTTHNASLYAFYPGNLKWPPRNYDLTYGFIPGTRADAIAALNRAFTTWANVYGIPLTFTRLTRGYKKADIQIGFFRGDHKDGYPFAPDDGVLAHSFPPTDGRFHFNADYSFSVDPVEGSYHLESLALHEIGHLIGLEHSSVEQAVMYPGLPPATVRGLDNDDMEGIRALYDF